MIRNKSFNDKKVWYKENNCFRNEGWKFLKFWKKKLDERIKDLESLF